MKESMRLVSAAASGFWQVLSDLMHVPMARCTIMLYMPTQNLSYTRVCVFVCVRVLVRVCQAALSTREVGEGEEPPAEIRKEAEAQRSVERGRQCAGLRWGGGGAYSARVCSELPLIRHQVPTEGVDVLEVLQVVLPDAGRRDHAGSTGVTVSQGSRQSPREEHRKSKRASHKGNPRL
jgi:hypothetical protein